MNWFTQIFSGSAGNLIEQAGTVADKFDLSGEEKQRFKLELESLLQRRDAEIETSLRAELQGRERMLVAELSQGDNYTKRARPTVVYAGLILIALNYCVLPLLAKLSGADAAPLELPEEFWWGWSGIVATWSVGRSFEKTGIQNQVTRATTGSQRISLLDEDIPRG